MTFGAPCRLLPWLEGRRTCFQRQRSFCSLFIFLFQVASDTYYDKQEDKCTCNMNSEGANLSCNMNSEGANLSCNMNSEGANLSCNMNSEGANLAIYFICGENVLNDVKSDVSVRVPLPDSERSLRVGVGVMGVGVMGVGASEGQVSDL